MNSEIRDLIREFKDFVLSSEKPPSFFEEVCPRAEVPRDRSHQKPVEQKPKEILLPSPPPSEKKEKEPPPPPEPIKSREAEMLALLKKNYPKLFREEIPTFAHLVTFEARSYPFLQKVAQALGDIYLPAKAHLCPNSEALHTLLAQPLVKLLLASPSETQLSGIFEKPYKIHHLKKTSKEIYWLPLYQIGNYSHDPSLKRSLWNTLKALPFADLLQ